MDTPEEHGKDSLWQGTQIIGVEKIVEKMRISFLGAGSWGTTLGILLLRAGHQISLWEIDEERVEKVRHRRRLPGMLPGIRIPAGLYYTSDIGEATRDAQVLVLALPCQALGSSLERLGRIYRPPKLVASVTKGLEAKTGLSPTQIWERYFPDISATALSGPSIAVEVAKGHPTALVAAGKDVKKAEEIQHLFSQYNLRVYLGDDPVGVELGGALKNIVAIGCGIAEGLGAGTNTRAALLARGIAEIARLGVKMGAHARTFAGLAGWGDLVTTAWNPSSRNHRVGLGLARGKHLDSILSELGMVAEGVETCRVARKLGRMHQVPMPITEATYRVLFESADPGKELKRLLARELKEEVW